MHVYRGFLVLCISFFLLAESFSDFFVVTVKYARFQANFIILVVVYGLLCLTPLSTIFHLFRGRQFYWWSKPEYT
jgi:hypothetical protein